jgi:hypothetical protein
MRTIKLFSVFALFGLVFFTACQKDNDNLTSEQIVASEDQTAATDLYQDVEDQVDQAIETRGGGGGGACPVVTIDPADGSYPRTMTIDFGDGCLGPNGRVRKGQIVVTLTDTLIKAGTVRTVTFVDFYVDDAKIEGTKTLTNLGFDANGNITLNRVVTGGKIIFPNGDVATWEANHTLTQTAGGNTPTFLDNVFEITGGSNGVNRHGKNYMVEIVTPLVKMKICPWIVSGSITLTVESKTVSIDYGDDTCDRKAILTLPNGETREILVHRWW